MPRCIGNARSCHPHLNSLLYATDGTEAFFLGPTAFAAPAASWAFSAKAAMLSGAGTTGSVMQKTLVATLCFDAGWLESPQLYCLLLLLLQLSRDLLIIGARLRAHDSQQT